MLGWFKALSLAGKIGVGLVSSVSIGTVVGLTSPPTPQPPVQPEAVVDSSVVKNESVDEPIPYKIIEQNDPALLIGTEVVAVAGVSGIKTITYKVTYTNGVETVREKTGETVTKQPTDQIIKVGTKVKATPKPRSNCDPNYSPCVPNVSYDLDCPDIGFEVEVIGYDKHGFDRDGDGYGCESY